MRAAAKHVPSMAHSPVEGDPDTQVETFVARGREMAHALGLDFEAACWQVGPFLVPLVGRPRHGTDVRIFFTERAGVGKDGRPLPASVDGLAKAIVVRMLGHFGLQAMRDKVDVLRLVGVELERRGAATVVKCTAGLFEAVVTEAVDRNPPGVAWRIAVQAELLAHFLGSSGMTTAPLLNWSCGVSPPPGLAGTAGPAFELNAAARLPTLEFIAGLGAAFALAEKIGDVVVSSVCAVLIAVPGRLSEVLNLEEDCLIDLPCDDVARVALRWPASKGCGPTVRFVPAPMTGVVREALRRLLALGAEARRVKGWYDREPGSLYLPDGLEHLRACTFISLADAASLLGVDAANIQTVCGRNGLDYVRGGRGDAPAIRFRQVEALLLSRVQPLLRLAGGPGYRPLTLVPSDAFHDRRLGSPCLFEPVRAFHVQARLRMQPGSPSMFQNVGIDPKGAIGGTTHSLRHWHTTRASEGGLSIEDQAEWFGRNGTRHVDAYNHATNRTIRAPLLGMWETPPGTGRFRKGSRHAA